MLRGYPSTCSAKAAEHVTQLLGSLAQDDENRGVIAKAGGVPELARQLALGSEPAMASAASGLALLALGSRATVTQELVKLLASEDEAVRQRASSALRDVAAGEKMNKAQRQGSTRSGRSRTSPSRSRLGARAIAEAIVSAGVIQSLIRSLVEGRLSEVAQEHAARVLSGLVPLGTNAQAIKEGGGIEPLCQLLRRGNPSAKVRAATTLGELALRAGAALDVAKAGAISAFVSWLVDPNLGQPEVAAAALSDIALDNPDTQAQIAEEGAIEPLVAMIAQGTRANALFTRPLAGAVVEAVVEAVVGAGTAHPASLPVPIPAPALASEPVEPVPPLLPPLLPPLALTTSVVASVVVSAAGVGAEEIGVPVLTGASPIEAGAVVGVMAGAVAGIDEAGVVAGAVAGIDESGVETGAVAGAELPTPRLATSQTESSMRSPQRSPRAGQP
ncbi:hypothetical protein Ctob_007480, partial [Chrysochromulina tobinii]